MANGSPTAIDASVRRFGQPTLKGQLLALSPAGLSIATQQLESPDLVVGSPAEIVLTDPQRGTQVRGLQVSFHQRFRAVVGTGYSFRFCSQCASGGPTADLRRILDEHGATRVLAPHPVHAELFAPAAGLRIRAKVIDLSLSGIGIECETPRDFCLQLGSVWRLALQPCSNLPQLQFSVGIRWVQNAKGSTAADLHVISDGGPEAIEARAVLLACLSSWRDDPLAGLPAS